MSIVEMAQQALAQKDFKKFDDLWTEMVLDDKVHLDTLFALARKLKADNESKRALLLLDMLVTHLESGKDYKKMIAVYKNMVYHVDSDAILREKIINLYKAVYSKSEHAGEYIELSGFTRGEPFFKSLERLDEFLAWDSGTHVYFERYGIGVVVDVIPSKKELVIDFEKKKRHFLTYDVARGLLMRLDEDHFLYKKHKHLDDLRTIALEHPVDLIKLMLTSFKEPLTAARIKMNMHGILHDDEIQKFWERTRKKLEQDSAIRIAGTPKTYACEETTGDRIEDEIASFKASPETNQYMRAEEYFKKMPDVFEKIVPLLIETANKVHKNNPALALDIMMLCTDAHVNAEFSFSTDTLYTFMSAEQMVEKLSNPDHQKRVLSIIREKNPLDWHRIFKNLLYTANDFKLLDALAQELADVPDLLRDIYYTVVSVPKNYPQLFRWLLKKMEAGELLEYLNAKSLPRLIDSLMYVKGIRASVNNVLTGDRVESILGAADDEDAQRLVDTITSSIVLEDYKKKDFLRMIEHHFPHLFAQEAGVIYTTETALTRRREELQKILTIDIPENKKDVGRAREYGDLSENFEYKAAKERQDQLYRRVRELEDDLKKARRIDPASIATDKVNVGVAVVLKNMDDGSTVQYTILGRWDTELSKNIISCEAPLAQKLLGKVQGEKVTIGTTAYEIIAIEKAL